MKVSYGFHFVIQVWLTKPSRRATHHTANDTNPTTDTELSGIRMAATSGVRWPETAKETPVTLYSKESMRLAIACGVHFG